MTDCTLTPPSAPNADLPPVIIPRRATPGYRIPAPPADLDLTDTPRRGPLFVLAHDEPAYHIWASPATPGSTGRSLCGIVTAWPDGGLYRTGRPKPRIADTTEGRRHLCAKCREAYVAAQYEEQMNRLADRLVRLASSLSDDRLIYSSSFAPTAIARQVARQVLRERGVLVAQATEDPMTAALLAQQTADMAEAQAKQTRALTAAVDALEMVPASPEIAALIEPVVSMGRRALGKAVA